MREIIRKNKIKSTFALAIMAIWYSIIYGLICAFFLNAFAMKFGICDDFSVIFIPFGILIALFIFYIRFSSIKNKPYEIASYTILPTNRTKHRQLYNVVEEIALASGIKKLPKIYILNCNILNAYACGLNPEKSSIVVSKKLLEILSREELQGVIAHEMSHIINRDTTYLLCSGALYVISAAFTLFFYEGMRGRSKGAALCLVMFLISCLGQGICFLLFMLISRKREYLADACAAQYTRYPKGLADALLKIEKGYCECVEADNLVKASFIAPLTKKGDSLTSTHPSTENRIKILLNMTSADYLEYEKQFEKLNEKNLIPKSVLNNSKKINIKQVQESIKVDSAVLTACALGVKADDKQAELIKENKEVLNQNIEKHREVENLVRDLAGYKVINCECETILKIPPVYENTIIICPHCKKKHTIN